MHRFARPLVLIAVFGLCGCGGALHSQQPPPKWTTGFWFWQGSSVRAAPIAETLDVIYFQGGTIATPDYGQGPHWAVWGRFPDELPAAREYWLVFRFESQGVPSLEAVPLLVRKISELLAIAGQRHLNVAGIQLDIDSPTRSLSRYASFLHEVRKGLPPGTGLSITALLDWFREGTAVGDVIKEVDEFVPQFYDLHDPRSYGIPDAIAAKFDGARWGPVFNRFGKRFRIGVSSFGRARFVAKAVAQGVPLPVAGLYFADLTPLDVAGNPAFNLQTSRNEAGELVLTYRASRKAHIGDNDIQAEDGFQFILPTPEAIRAAVESAKRIGGSCAGVIFFRWPASDETLIMQPDEALAAASGGAQPPQANSLELADGGCAAVSCTDVFFISANPLRPTAVRYRIHSSTALEYFLPEKAMPIRMAGQSDLELSLPPYGARRRMYLGRAVTMKHAQFTIREEP